MDFSFRINENFRFNFDGFFQKNDEKNSIPIKDSVLVFGDISGKSALRNLLRRKKMIEKTYLYSSDTAENFQNFFYYLNLHAVPKYFSRVTLESSISFSGQKNSGVTSKIFNFTITKDDENNTVIRRSDRKNPVSCW